MIITQTKNEEVVKSQEFQSKKFSITDSGKNKLFKLLVMNLYQNIDKSLIREITCNAIDANKESGTNKNAEIEYIPKNSLLGQEETLIIRDFGIGISPERMWDTFINLGESTKDTSNDFIGGFGIGCKTIFAYSDNTMIITVNNGIRYTYIACINEFDEPEMNLISKQETQSPSGTEVYILIKSWYEINNAINSELYYLKDNITFINYKPDFKDLQTYYENDNIVYNTYDSEFHIILGNIRYDIPLLNDRTKTPYGEPQSHLSVGLKFNIGELNPTPSRESLRWDSKSESLVQDRIKSAKLELIENYINPKLKGCTSLKERWHINMNSNLEKLIGKGTDFDILPYKKYHFKKDINDNYFQYRVYRVNKKIKYRYFKEVTWENYLFGRQDTIYFTNDTTFKHSKDLANSLKQGSVLLVKRDIDVSRYEISQLKGLCNTLRFNKIMVDEISTFATPIESVEVIPLETPATIKKQYQKKANLPNLTSISVKTLMRKDDWRDSVAFRNSTLDLSTIPSKPLIIYGNANDSTGLLKLGIIFKHHKTYSGYGTDFLKNVYICKINAAYNSMFKGKSNCIHITEYDKSKILSDFKCHELYSTYKYILDIELLRDMFPNLKEIYEKAILVKDTYTKFQDEIIPEVENNLEAFATILKDTLLPYINPESIPTENLNNYLKTIFNESTNQLLSNTNNN